MPAMVIALLAVAWMHDERSAAEEAHRSGKELLVDFQADWCAACKMMERHTWTDPRVQREPLSGGGDVVKVHHALVLYGELLRSAFVQRADAVTFDR